jgi:hypothetical protein
VAEFLVEAYTSRTAPSGTVPRVEDLAVASKQVSEEGAEVRLLRAISVPDDEVCFYLFQSPSAEAVQAATARAGLQCERITAAVSSVENSNRAGANG